jgi:hypothetical protein
VKEDGFIEERTAIELDYLALWDGRLKAVGIKL